MKYKDAPKSFKIIFNIVLDVVMFFIMFLFIKYWYGGSNEVSMIVGFEYVLFGWWARYSSMIDKRIKEGFR
jgi:hypothetical protein